MQDLNWFPFSLSATVLFGISMAFYKLPSVKDQKRYAVSFWQLFFCFLFSLIFFLGDLSSADVSTVLYGFLWGASFFVLSVTQMKALKTIETNTLYPITTSASLFASVLFGILFFKDHISLIQLAGMVSVVGVVLLFSYSGGKLKHSKEVLWIGSAIIFLSAFGKIVQKFAADSVDIHPLQIFQYFFATLFAFLVCLYFFKKESKKHIFSNSVKSGFLIGVPSFFGGYMLLLALERGPFSLITSIHSLYVLVTALLGYFIFKEKLTVKKIILILLAILAVTLIKIG